MTGTRTHEGVEVRSFVDNGKTTIVEVSTVLNGEQIVVRGSAALAPGDKFDREVGFALALGRALDKLAHRATKQGWGIVNHRDQMKDHKPIPIPAWIARQQASEAAEGRVLAVLGSTQAASTQS